MGWRFTWTIFLLPTHRAEKCMSQERQLAESAAAKTVAQPCRWLRRRKTINPFAVFDAPCSCGSTYRAMSSSLVDAREASLRAFLGGGK